MKKFVVLASCLISTLSAFANNSYSTLCSVNGEIFFSFILGLAWLILSIVILVRWWKMTTNIEEIRQHLTPASPKLTYLVAIGEKEQAEKAALKMLVDLLLAEYSDNYNSHKAKDMNQKLTEYLPKIEKLGISVPDYVTSGEKFIDYMNSLTGKEVSYEGY